VPFSRETTKQEELFDYTNVPDYYKEKIMNKNEKVEQEKEYDLSL